MCVAAGQPDIEVSGAFPHCGMDPEGSAASSSLGTATLLPPATSNIPIHPIDHIQYIYKIRIIDQILCTDLA